MWVSSPSYLEYFGLLFPHPVNGTDVHLMQLCLEALVFLLVVVASDNVASLPKRRAVAGCSQLLCQACLVLVHSGTAARDCLLHGNTPRENQQFGTVSFFFSFLRLCRTKDGVTDIAVVESCHLLSLLAPKQYQASCEGEYLPLKENGGFRVLCAICISDSVTWMSSPSAACTNARQICLGHVRRPVSTAVS